MNEFLKLVFFIKYSKFVIIKYIFLILTLHFECSTPQSNFELNFGQV